MRQRGSCVPTPGRAPQLAEMIPCVPQVIRRLERFGVAFGTGLLVVVSFVLAMVLVHEDPLPLDGGASRMGLCGRRLPIGIRRPSLDVLGRAPLERLVPRASGTSSSRHRETRREVETGGQAQGRVVASVAHGASSVETSDRRARRGRRRLCVLSLRGLRFRLNLAEQPGRHADPRRADRTPAGRRSPTQALT